MSNVDIHTIRKKNQEAIQLLEARLERYSNTAMQYSIWLIPLVPALFSTVSVARVYPSLFHIPEELAWFMAIMTGIAVELLGFRSVELMFAIQHYNANRKVDQPAAPFIASVVAVAFYVLMVLVIVVFLKIFPALAIYSIIGLTMMGLIVGLLVNISKQFSSIIDANMEAEQEHGLSERVEHLTNEITERDKMFSRLDDTLYTVREQLEALSSRMNIFERSAECTVIQMDETKASVQSVTSSVQEVARLYGHAHERLNTIEQSLEHVIALAVQNIEQSIECTVQDAVTSAMNVQPQKRKVAKKADSTQRLSKVDRQSQLIKIIATELHGSSADDLNKSELASRLGTSHVTIGRDIEELIELKKLSINGVVKVK